jgi:hypothetical protein
MSLSDKHYALGVVLVRCNEMNEWKPFSGRITLFPIAAPPPSAPDLYRLVWGIEPDTSQKQSNPLVPTIAQGKRDSILAGCFCHPSRIDFNLFSSLSPAEMQELSLPLIEDTSQFHDELMRIIGALRKGAVSNPISRIALGVQFVSPKLNFLECNKILISVMPIDYRVKITDEEDLVFQVNRPRASTTVENLRMNVLTKWSVERMHIMSMTAAPSIVAISLPPATTPGSAEFLAASVSFDINNAPATPSIPIDSQQQSSLLLESIDEAKTTQRDLGLNIGGF